MLIILYKIWSECAYFVVYGTVALIRGCLISWIWLENISLPVHPNDGNLQTTPSLQTNRSIKLIQTAGAWERFSEAILFARYCLMKTCSIKIGKLSLRSLPLTNLALVLLMRQIKMRSTIIRSIRHLSGLLNAKNYRKCLMCSPGQHNSIQRLFPMIYNHKVQQFIKTQFKFIFEHNLSIYTLIRLSPCLLLFPVLYLRVVF